MPSGGGGSTTQTVKQDPWKEQQPYLKEVFPLAQELYQSGGLDPKAYGGQTVADFSPESLLAQQLTTQRATNGSPVTNAAKDNLTATIQGDYLNSNPYLDSMFNKAADSVQSRVNSAFGGGGRFGSGLNQDVMGKNLNNLATDIYGQNYQQERGRQLQAAGMAPQLAAQDYTDLAALQGVGGAKEGQEQALINEAINRFNIEQEAPATALQRYQQLISGNYGGTTTSTQPYYGNTAGNVLGGALGLGSLGNMLGLFGGGAAAASSLPAVTGAVLPWLAASDSRIKEDISYLRNENGHRIHRFRYKGYPEYYEGVMAQEVREIAPDAVLEIGGVLHVDYGRIGVEFKQVLN